jgi:predicted translin family RNA/ssDNA-binding protein
MGNQNQEKFIQACVNKSEGWGKAIDEAERQIKEAEEKIKRLKLSIQTFKEMIAQGEPFPGESAEQNQTEAA